MLHALAIIYVLAAPPSYSEQHESWIVVRRGHHWLHCVSHKSGVPMWILSSILFLSSFFLLWLCCAATVTSPSAKKSHRPEKKVRSRLGFCVGLVL
jgi:hypothetical protein